MSFHLLLLKWHPMIGGDLHMELTFTWPPVPVPFTPHLVGQFLGALGGIGPGGPSMTGDDVLANNWNIILRDSDIQYGIPHVPIPLFPPCVLAPLWTLLSGSKSYFGPSSVHANGKPIAAALDFLCNPQLNCNDPLPLPTGRAYTWSTVVCGLTCGDVIGGFLSMGLDMVISWVLNKLGDDVLGGGIVGNALLQQLTGSPVGYTYSAPGHLIGDWANPGNWGVMAGHLMGDSIDTVSHLASSVLGSPLSATTSIFANDPAVEQH